MLTCKVIARTYGKPIHSSSQGIIVLTWEAAFPNSGNSA